MYTYKEKNPRRIIKRQFCNVKILIKKGRCAYYVDEKWAPQLDWNSHREENVFLAAIIMYYALKPLHDCRWHWARLHLLSRGMCVTGDVGYNDGESARQKADPGWLHFSRGRVLHALLLYLNYVIFEKKKKKKNGGSRSNSMWYATAARDAFPAENFEPMHFCGNTYTYK